MCFLQDPWTSLSRNSNMHRFIRMGRKILSFDLFLPGSTDVQRRSFFSKKTIEINRTITLRVVQKSKKRRFHKMNCLIFPVISLFFWHSQRNISEVLIFDCIVISNWWLFSMSCSSSGRPVNWMRNFLFPPLPVNKVLPWSIVDVCTQERQECQTLLPVDNIPSAPIPCIYKCVIIPM